MKGITRRRFIGGALAGLSSVFLAHCFGVAIVPKKAIVLRVDEAGNAWLLSASIRVDEQGNAALG